MSWQGIEGHDDVVEQFRRRLASGKVTGTFLFVGPPGVGKRTFAFRLAQALLCRRGASASLDPCGECEDCRLAAAGTHPDLLYVAKPPDRSEIPLKLLIGEGETRMREGLCHDIALRPYRGGRRVAIIDDADDLNSEGANSLLKTLEEPPPRSVMILLSESADRQLPTIRSRSQLIRFRPLDEPIVARLALEAALAENREQAQHLAAMAEGSLDRARRLSDPELTVFRRELYDRLRDGAWDAPTHARALSAFAEQAGKEPAARRERLRLAIGFLAEFFRQVIRVSLGEPDTADPHLRTAAEGARHALPAEAESLADAVDRCLEALDHVDRNAHPTTLVDALCDDLARILAGRGTEIGARS